MNNPLVQPDPGLFLWTIATFLVLLWLLAKFAWKPLLAMLAKREETIRKSLEDAEKARLDLESIKEKSDKILIEAHNAAQTIIANGKSNAEKMKDEILKNTKIKSDSILEKAKRQINSEKGQAISDIKTEVVSLSLEIASKLIKKNLSEKDHQAIIDDSLKEMQVKNEA